MDDATREAVAAALQLLDEAYDVERPCLGCGRAVDVLYDAQAVNQAHRVLHQLMNGETPLLPRPTRQRVPFFDDDTDEETP